MLSIRTILSTIAACCLACIGCQQPVLVRQAALTQQPEAIPPPGASSPAPLAPPALAPPALVSPGNDTPPPIPLPLPAQPEPPKDAEIYSVEDLEQLALINNPTLVRAQALVAAARGNWVQVGLPPNFSWGYNGQQLGSGNLASQHGLMIDGEFVTGGKLRWNRAVAEQEIVRAEQNMFAQQQRVMTDIRINFYEALIAQRSLDLAHQLLKIAGDAQTTAKQLFDVGETSESEFRLAEIEVFNAENNLNNSKQRHFAAWQTLRAVLGLPHLQPAVLKGDLETIPDNITWDDALGRLLSVSPEIGAAMANVERARAAVVRAHRQAIPNFRFQGGVQQDQGINGKTDGLVQALVPLPLINWNQGGIAEAQAELTAAHAAVQQVELDLQNRLAPVFERYSSAAYRVRRYREKILPSAERSLDLVRVSYRAGELPFLNLLIAQQRYFLTSRDYLQSLLDLRTSAAQIEGLLLTNSLGTAP